jgi:hypothetical protein
MANGGANPERRIEGQATLLARTMHSIHYNPIHDEISVAVPAGGAVLTFRGGADGEEPPIRVIQGPLTQIVNWSGRLGLDPVNDELLVPEGKKVLVFSRTANGNVPPIRVLEGPDTRLGAGFVAVDHVHDLMVVVGGQAGERRNEILIFDRKASGNTKPKRVVSGPNTMLWATGGPFTVHPEAGKILVPIRGRISQETMIAPDSFVGIWSIDDNGDVPPLWTLGGPRGAFQMIRGIAVNAKHKEVIVTDKRLNAVLTFSVPEIF